MKKYIKPKTILPADAKFYSLTLTGDGFELNHETLDQHYSPVPKGRNSFKGVWAKCTVFERELAIIEVTMPSEKLHYLYMHVEEKEMQVHCNCGMPGEQLCKHAYYGLSNLMYYKESFNFKLFYWPGFSGGKGNGGKFLEVEAHSSYITIKPKKIYGNLFRPILGLEQAQSLIIEKQNNDNLTLQTKGNGLTLGYCIAYKYKSMPAFHLPLLVPFIGKIDISGTRIIQFKELIINDTTAPKVSYTGRQIMLNSISHEMYDIVGSLEAMTDKEHSLNSLLKQKLLELWHKAIEAGLVNEPFLYTYFSRSFKALVKKPEKLLMRKCNMKASPVGLSFLLKENADHYSLQAVITSGAREVEFKGNKFPLFITQENDHSLYLASNIQDDDLLNWLSHFDNRITILKAHFILFYAQYLKRLCECYPVMFQAYGSKKKVLFDHSVIALAQDVR